MHRVTVRLRPDSIIGTTDKRLFGAFVEHLGRCVYGGLFEPGHPTADQHGFRRDVLALVQELAPSVIRYPGGNFVSGYNWEDGVGPVDQRPARLDLAWLSTETNRFGTNEFIDWCRKAQVEPMLGVNLGTRGPDEARRFVEYCNHAGGSTLSDLRRAHGYEQPHGVKFWCLGNEMDGPWQICHKTAEEYGRAALETAKVMRWVDPTVQLAACGSSHRNMPTYGTWEYEVLDRCFEEVDFISLHTYFRNDADDLPEYFGVIELMDAFIREVVAICDAVAAKRRSHKRIMLSYDEWNVWYRTHQIEHMRRPGWPSAPRLIEEMYNVEDALIVGGALITLMNNADRVKAACLAQLANVIGPIMTEPGGAAWRQTIFHPFALASRHGHGRVMQARVDSSAYAAKAFPEIPYLCASVVDNPADGTTTIFALNRHLTEPLDLSAQLRGLGGRRLLTAALEIHDPKLKAVNTKDTPNAVVPRTNTEVSVNSEQVTARLKPASWNVIVTRAAPGSR